MVFGCGAVRETHRSSPSRTSVSNIALLKTFGGPPVVESVIFPARASLFLSQINLGNRLGLRILLMNRGGGRSSC